jgi:beta-lactamase regulating signal transducer with metallopeptidase domain
MSDFLAQRVLLFAGEAFAASVLAMALAWIAAPAKRASLRHLAFVAGFGALTLLPLLAIVVPGGIVLTVPSAMPPPATSAPMDAIAAAPVVETFHFGLGDAAMALIVVWIAGVALIALRGLVAGLVLRALRRDSALHPFDASELPVQAARLRYDLRLSRSERGPLTWGVFRPVILLPNAAQCWPYERLQAVLRHEFAHVGRRDGASQMLAQIACALYWPNPLVWLGARAMRREAEIAADDVVIASGMTPSDYAEELLHMAAEFRAQGVATALAMAAPSALPARVQSILAPTQQRSGVTSMDVLKMTAIALLTTGALVAARPSFAQDVPPVPPMPVAELPAPPPAPPAPPAPLSDADAPTPPAPPAPSAPPAPPSHADRIVRVIEIRGPHKSRIVKTMRIELDDADAMARVKPDLDRAMAEVRVHEVELRQIEAMRPEIDAQVRSAMAQARAQVALIDDVKIRAKVDAALARVQARLAHARRGEGRAIVLDDGADKE